MNMYAGIITIVIFMLMKISMKVLLAALALTPRTFSLLTLRQSYVRNTHEGSFLSNCREVAGSVDPPVTLESILCAGDTRPT